MTCAGVYCRISDDRAGLALGVARQEQDGRALAARKGWDVVDVYVDNDISASRRGGKRKVRPEYDRLLNDVKNGVISAVIAWDFDRLFRDPLQQEEFFLLCEQVGNVWVATIGTDVSIDSGYGLLEARIRAAFAAEEVRKISQRARRKHVEIAEAGGLSGGGTRPFGFDKDRRTIRADEAALIRDAADRILAGEALRGVCAAWNAAGVPTVTGKPWTPHVLKRTITSGRVCGWREHHGELTAPAQWPAILSRDVVDQLRAVLRDPARRTNTLARRYLLTGGIARCGLCNAPLVARPRDDKARRYICARGPGFSGCGKTYILADPLEGWVTDLLLAHVDSDAYRAAVRDQPAPDDPTSEIEAAEAKLADLAAEWAADGITRVEWQSARKALTARLDAARRRSVPAPRSVGPDLAATWPSMTFDQRRAAVALLVDSVVVGPAVRGLNRFDPRRVSVTWRV